jgi:hypothetical protein
MNGAHAGKLRRNGENVFTSGMKFPPSVEWMPMRRSAELAAIAGIDSGRVAVLEALDFAAAGDGDTVACFPFGGRRRQGGFLFLSKLESEQFWLILHCTILL